MAKVAHYSYEAGSMAGSENSAASENGWQDRARARAQANAPDWMLKHSNRVSSGLRLTATGLQMISGAKYHSWARIASGATVLGGNLITASYAEQPAPAEEEATLARLPILPYFSTRLQQTFNPKAHIRQTTGLTMMLGGSFGMVSGIQSHRTSEAISGGIYAIGGGILCFTNNAATAWKHTSTLFTTCLTPAGAWNAIANRDPFIGGLVVLSQSANAVDYLYGGGKKSHAKVIESPRSGGEEILGR